MKNRNSAVSLAIAAIAILGGLSAGGCPGSQDLTRSVEVRTSPFVAVAEGELPRAPEPLHFPASVPPELLWITGIRTEMVNEDGSPATDPPGYRTDVGFEYFRHARILELPVYHTDRLFTLTPRQTELVFPAGFGMPFYSDEVLTVSTRALEADATGAHGGVQQRVVLEFVYDRDLTEPMKPLFATSGRWVASSDGRQERVLELPYDTQAHHITAPLLSGADSVELRESTTGEAVYNSAAASLEEGGATYFSAAEGIQLLEDRPYLLVGKPDAPASEVEAASPAMLLYLRDKLYKKRPRQRAPVAHFDEKPKTSDQRLILHTNHGKLEIVFYEEVAPRHYKQILELARLGVYDGVKFHRIEPGYLVQLGYPERRLGDPLNDKQQAALRRLEAELSDLPMKRWTVGMALRDNADPDSAVASFFVLLTDARHIDQKFTIVGRVISGLGTLNTIANVPQRDGSPVEPVYIEMAEVKSLDELTAERLERSKRAAQQQGD